MNVTESKAQLIAEEATTLFISGQAIIQSGRLSSFPDTDFSIEACETVASATQTEATLWKFFNKEFREKATEFMFETALQKVA